MSERDFDLPDERAKALARLATLQRIRDQAKQDGMRKMSQSIEELMAAEHRKLAELRDSESEPA